MKRDIITKVSYVLDNYTKRRLGLVLIVILLGGIAELVGVSAILPIINLAVDPREIYSNSYCRIIMWATGIQDVKGIMLILIVLVMIIYIAKDAYLCWMSNTMFRFSTNVQRKMAVRLMKAYLSQPYSFFVKNNSAELIRSVSSDTGNFKEVVLNGLNMASNVVTSAFLLGYMLKSNWQITTMVFVLVFLCFLFMYKVVNKRMRRYGAESQKLNGYVIKALQEAFQGIKEIKILGREDFFVNRYEGNYSKNAEISRKNDLLRNAPKYIIEAVAICAIMAYLGLMIISEGGYSQYLGQLGVFALASFKLLPMVNSTYYYASSVAYHAASVDLIYNDIKNTDELMKQKQIESSDREIPFEKTIILDDISFRYENSQDDVLKNVSIRINKGESIGIVGKTGGGKTTTVDVLLGLITPHDGKVLSDDVNISQNYKSWLSKVGYIPQSIYLSDSSIRANIAFGLEDEQIDDTKIQNAIAEAQLRTFIDTLPEKENTVIGEGGVRLSGGQRQRIGIARALYNDPDILVLDEATSALDNETEAAVMEAIDRLHGSKTLIIIAHRLTTVLGCDKIYEIADHKARERDRSWIEAQIEAMK